MRVYEATFIFKPEAENLERGQALVKDVLTKAGGTIVNEDDMGERALAYAVKKVDRGHYFCYELEWEPAAIHEAERALQVAPEILKYLIVRKEA